MNQPHFLSKTLLLIIMVLVGNFAAAANYAGNEQVQAFAKEVAEELKLNDKEQESLQAMLSSAERKESILKAMSRPAEKTKAWHEYRDIFLKGRRVSQGVAFWQEHRVALERAESVYAVPAEYIVAIIGVETRYGRNMGSFRVLDALATLGFDYPKRATFFKSELKSFVKLAKQQNWPLDSVKGSYAGAMGFGQFIPSSYLAYAVDFDNDGQINIIDNPVDAIGSVANYFKVHGWQAGQPVAVRAKVVASQNRSEDMFNQGLERNWTTESLAKVGVLPKSELPAGLDGKWAPLKLEAKQGTEYWLGARNFYVITRYNRSRLYAMAVRDLATQIASVMFGS